MDRYLDILPAAVTLFWIIRIFFLGNVNKVQLYIVWGMIMAVLTIFYGRFFVLFVFPLFHMAVRQKTCSGGVTKWDWAILLPSFLLEPYTDTRFFVVFLCLQIAFITVWSVMSVRKYEHRFAELYDSGGEMSAEDIGQVLTFMIITVLVFVIEMILPTYVASYFWVRLFLASFVALLQFMIGYYTFRMKDTSLIAEELSDDSMLADGKQEALSTDDELIRKAVNDELFLDPTISLVSMAEKLGTNRTYLSNSIHSCRGMNFSDFVNSLRIEYFTRIVGELGPEANIKEAAMRSGYSNLQSFYRNFSEIMKVTPAVWIRENLKEK